MRKLSIEDLRQATNLSGRDTGLEVSSSKVGYGHEGAGSPPRA